MKKPLVVLGMLALSTAFTPLAGQLPRRPTGRHYQVAVTPAGDSIRYTLYVPEKIAFSGARVPLIVATHYGGQVSRWMGGQFADLLVVPGLGALEAVIVAPDAGTPRGWSAEDEARVMWLARQVRDVYPIDPAKVLLTGFSAGGAQAWAIGNRNQDFFTAVIPLSARPPRMQNAWRIPVLAIHSRDDGMIELGPVEEYVARQKAAGAPVELHVVTGLAHHQTAAFAGPLREAVGWLQASWR
jgi:predicted peptidase